MVAIRMFLMDQDKFKNGVVFKSSFSILYSPEV